MSWRPVDLNDIEQRMVDLEPDKDFIFRRQTANEEDDKRRNIIDKRRSEEDNDLMLLTHLHDSNIIPKIPGKLLDREDLVNSDPTVETVKMMRAMGMQPSSGSHMIQSRSISTKKKQPSIIYDGNRPVMLGSEFFKFRLLRAKELQGEAAP